MSGVSQTRAQRRLQAAVADILVVGAVGHRQQGGYGQNQAVPSHAHGIHVTRALPAAPLATPEALLNPVAAGVQGRVGGVSAGRSQASLWFRLCSTTRVPGKGSRPKAVSIPSQKVPGPPPSDRAGTQ